MVEQGKKVIVDNITKIYNMYNTPMDRLKEAFSLNHNCLHTEFYALTNVSFEVKKGEIVGIMGRNGAGKSTLLKIITGVLQPTYGTVRVSGRISSLLELGAGFNMEYSGIDNIHFYGTIMGLNHEEITRRLDDILSFAEIGDYVYQPVKTYSSGMFARLAFSCAINVDPEILIVDEILSVGDIRFQAKCFKKFKKFKEKGVTILYVGHDIGTMRSFCDRCIWLNQGKIVDCGDPTYISAKYVEFMYLDDISEFTSYRALGREEAQPAVEAVVETAAPDAGLETVEAPFEAEQREDRMERGKPLAHWGSRTGCIRGVSLQSNGEELGACGPMDTVTISFSIPYMEDVEYPYLSAAFSIKNREGVVLIVSTTYDDGVRLKPEKRGHTFRFSFQPRIANGDYYLVVALENRKEAVTTYYEYIEGAKYFKIFQSKTLYGQFFPEIKMNVQGDILHESI